MADQPCVVAIGAHTADMEFTAAGALLIHVRHRRAQHAQAFAIDEDPMLQVRELL